MTSAPAAPAHAQSVPAVDQRQFRDVLGHFCTGLTVITAMDGDRPAGFACQSFASLSVDPALVLFCVKKTSYSWQQIARAGRFAVNMLARSQRDVCAGFGRGGPDKFDGVRWSPSPTGSPVLDGGLAWLDCRIEAAHDGGDHHIVVGRVTDLSVAGGEPLLYHRGDYTTTAPDSPTPRGPLTFGAAADFVPDDWF